MNENTDYEKLRLDVLQQIIELRSIPFKVFKRENDTKKGIIELLILDDQGKYVRETTHEKSEGGYIIGIDFNNKKHMSDISKLVEKKEAHKLSRYCDNRLQYWSNQKLL
jgi:hypothetical protein